MYFVLSEYSLLSTLSCTVLCCHLLPVAQRLVVKQRLLELELAPLFAKSRMCLSSNAFNSLGMSLLSISRSAKTNMV